MPTVEQKMLRDKIPELFNKITTVLSPNYSSRYGQKVKLAVVHTTESSDQSFQAILNYFRTRASQVSASYVVDAIPIKSGDEFTRVTLCVPERFKPWTQKNANPVSVSYELIGRANRTREQWLTTYRAQIRTVAALIAEDCLQYGLPPKLGYPGYAGHVHLSRFGFPQNHTDPGVGFPWDVFDKDLEKYYAMGKNKGVPNHNTIKLDAKGRPADAPKRIPRWAWKLDKWYSAQPAKRKRKPALPAKFNGRVPQWFWHWRLWIHGLLDQPHDTNI